MIYNASSISLAVQASKSALPKSAGVAADPGKGRGLGGGRGPAAKGFETTTTGAATAATAATGATGTVDTLSAFAKGFLILVLLIILLNMNI